MEPVDGGLSECVGLGFVSLSRDDLEETGGETLLVGENSAPAVAHPWAIWSTWVAMIRPKAAGISMATRSTARRMRPGLFSA